MRRCRAALTALVYLLISLLTVQPVSAGGPTSVLLVAPQSGRTASLYTTDADYDRLAQLVGAFGGNGVGGTTDPSKGGHAVGQTVTVTWLIHDVGVWRVDRIYPDAKGGPWISTQADITAGDPWDGPTVWHTSTDGDKLITLLDQLGVTEGSQAKSSAETADVAAAPVAPALAAPQRTRAMDPQAAQVGSRTPAWTWGLTGVAGGVVLALVALRVRGRLPMERNERTPDLPTEGDVLVGR